MFQYTQVSGWFMPKITKLCLNLSKLCLEYCGLYFFSYTIYYMYAMYICICSVLWVWLQSVRRLRSVCTSELTTLWWRCYQRYTMLRYTRSVNTLVTVIIIIIAVSFLSTLTFCCQPGWQKLTDFVDTATFCGLQLWRQRGQDFSSRARLNFQVPRVHLKLRECAFSVAAAKAWTSYDGMFVLLSAPTLSNWDWKHFYCVNFTS